VTTPLTSGCLCSASQTYVDYMSRLYEREIKDFFEVAKIKMAGASKEAKGKFGKTPTFDPRPRSAYTSLFVWTFKNNWFSSSFI